MDTIKELVKYLIAFVFSPTWLLADYLKNKYDRKTTIKNLNAIYLSVSLITIVTLLLVSFFKKVEPNSYISNKRLLFFWSWFLFSRINEICFAFLNDAHDRLKALNKSKLNGLERILLAFTSYIELIINFSILYSFFKISSWDGSIRNMFDYVYFSGVTITTTGYGDISPISYILKFLSLYEVFSGVIILVICFALYTNSSDSANSEIHSNQKKKVFEKSHNFVIFIIAILLIIVRIIFPEIKFDNISLYLFIVAVVSVLIPNIGETIERVKKLKKGDFEIEFSEQLANLNRETEKVEEQIANQIDKKVNIVDDKLDKKIEKIIENMNNSRGALITLSVEIEASIRNLGEKYQLPRSMTMNTVRTISELSKRNYISEEVFFLFKDFWAIRNRAAHDVEFDLHEFQQYNIIDIGIRILKLLSISNENI